MTRPGGASVALFSYGTLQRPNVQFATFGRLLEGRPDSLSGFALAPLPITDPQVIATSGAAVHTIAVPTGDPADLIEGVVYAVTSAELAAADGYEVDAYARVEVRLASGDTAFVYVGPKPELAPDPAQHRRTSTAASSPTAAAGQRGPACAIGRRSTRRVPPRIGGTLACSFTAGRISC